MIKPQVFGGIGEYGRACFFLDIPQWKFLLDAGVMKGKGLREEERLPKIPRSLIPEIQGIFLSHSHEDHVGALPYLMEEGFNGTLFSSAETKDQILSKKNYAEVLENVDWVSLDYQGEIGSYTLDRGADLSPITLEYGSTGHMIGSLWLSIQWEGNRGFYSGDFSMNSFIYDYDLPKSEGYQWGIVDGAYDDDRPCQQENIKSIQALIKEGAKNQRKLLFPLPVKGRGLEILALMAEMEEETIYVERKLFREIEDAMDHTSWLHRKGKESIRTLQRIKDRWNILDEKGFREIQSSGKKGMLIFLGDSKMEKPQSQRIYYTLQEQDRVVFTGNPGKNTFGDQLLKQNNMRKKLPEGVLQYYNVHLTQKEGMNFGKKINIQEPMFFHHP